MKATAMCFSLLQLPRCRIHTLASSLFEGFHKLGSCSRGNSSYRVLCSNHEPEVGHSRKWTRRTINTKAEGCNKSLVRKSSEPDGYTLATPKVRRTKKVGVGDKAVSRNKKSELFAIDVESTEVQSNQDFDELAKLATIICFDIETTGFRREDHRIIEIAFQDLRGGEYSTFQTLVNPEREVPNKEIHGISTSMVNRHDVPRMKELIPVILQFIKSRQLPGGIVVLVSHNGQSFDVPFLKNEFRRWSYEIPEDWVFADTIPLARTALKLTGAKNPRKTSLLALREHYGIPLIGRAHSAQSDVHSLALVLQRLTYDLKLTVADLIQRSFK